MKKLLVIALMAGGVLAARPADAQSVLPRAGWVANASSSNGGDVPSHVLDGSSSTRWTTGGDQTPGQWFTIDFGSQQTFTQVTMDVGSNTTDYARSYELYVSNDGQTWGPPVASGTGATGIITIVFPSQTARYVGIVQTGSSTTNWWSIVELNVYAGTVPTVPLTPSGWTATASVSGSSDQPSKAIDGNLSTRFSTDAVQVNGQTFQLDMGSPQLIAGLKMDSGTNTTDYARGYQIFASNSTGNWGSAIASGTGTSSPITVYFLQTTARYVKIVETASASNWWSIAELTMYTVGSYAPSASVLARTGWGASASSSGSGTGPANALDDNGSTRWSTAANQTSGQYFVVDMQATRSITKLTLDTGSSSTGDYPRGYQVFVSADGTNWGSTVATGNGSSQLTTITFPVQVGRYVKIVQTGSSSTNRWSIAELNVYGTPPAILLRDNWTASAALDSGDAQLGIDGRAETQWSTEVAQTTGQTYQVDMKATQSFDEVTLDVECNPADYPRGVQVYVSSNGTSWGSPVGSATGTAAIVTIAFAAQNGRYVKVVSTASASNYWGIAELTVINTNPAACSSPCVALDQCHDVGTCDPGTGVCSNPLKANGTTCSDGNACTQADTCQAGVCTGGSPVTCTASDQCHAPGVCNTSTGVCSNPTKTDGTSCSDGNACTQTDTCQAGVCTSGVPVTCTASDQCHVPGTCDPTSGSCSNPTKTDGTSCSDGNACTQTDRCQAGVCTGGSPVTCTASDQCHAAGTCDPSSGACSNPPVANGTSCNDGNACTQVDTCQAGACIGASPVACAATDQCHVAGVCSPTTGACSNPVATNGTTCSDGNACTLTDTCQAGVCTGSNPVTCAATDQCHLAGACIPTTGACTNPTKTDGTGCSDGNACTQTDICVAGTCTGGNPVTCGASDQCHSGGTCNPSTGACSNPTKADGTGCSDGNACTQTDTCVAGVCTGSNPVTCTASDQCHSAGTCNSTTGVCSNPTKADGTSCSDGNACTQADTCVAGVCTGGSPVTCTASDQCHSPGTCDPTSGACSNTAKTNGSACDDGNPATTGDQCVAGVCAGTTSSSCPPPTNTCRIAGIRDPATGNCTYPFKADYAACNDGNPATFGDYCQGGTCTGRPAPIVCTSDYVSCDDGNPCTINDYCYNGTCGGQPVDCGSTNGCGSYCDLATGACTTGPVPDGSLCDDGNVCTSGDSCSAGSCVGVSSCANGLNLISQTPFIIAQPSLPVVLGSSVQSVHPNETLNLNGTVTYEGVAFSTSGEVDFVNNGALAFTIGGYSMALEYQSVLTSEWVPLASTGFDANGVEKLQTAPYTLTFQESPYYTTGTVYPPGGGLAGAVISGGNTAPLYMSANAMLPPAALATLSDPTQSAGLRAAFRLDPTPGLPDGAEVLFPFAFPLGGGDLTVSNVTGQINFDGTFFPGSATNPSTLHPGDVATFQAAATSPAASPASAYPGIFNNGYQGYLQYLAQQQHYAIGFSTVGGTEFGAGTYPGSQPVYFSSAVPIVVPSVTSATTVPFIAQNIQWASEAPAGFPVTWAMTVSNIGTEAASNIAIADEMLRFNPTTYITVPPATVTGPTALAVEESEPGTIAYQSDPVADNGMLVEMQGGATWRDTIGNVYGPLRGQPGWPVSFDAPLPLGALWLSGQSGSTASVTSTIPFTVTAVDPSGHPAPGLTVSLAVTGANPQTLTAMTDASGIAQFPFKGLLPGDDSIVANATLTTGPSSSNTVNMFWTAPYGTPCASNDGPLDIVVSIDTSSSMEGAPLDAAKAATLAFLNTMDLTRDQFGVVSFGGFAGLNVGLTSDFATASAGIESVEPGGNGFINPTSIGAGLSAALDELASSRARPTATPIIVFISDGGNSFGDPEPALARLKAAGIRTFVLGIGDADFVMLNRIASSKSDLYYTPSPAELSWLYSNMSPSICRKQVPLVYAGGNQGAYGVRLPDSLELRGEVHDPGPPDDPQFTSTWSLVTGPGTVTFTDASSPTTNAFFTDPGTYVLKLEASDGFNTASDTATVVVDSEPSLAGAALVATLDTPGPLTVGSSESLVATLTGSAGNPIANFPVQVTITGPNAGASTLTTNSNGVATFTYTGRTPGTDVLSAVALGITQLTAPAKPVTWEAAAGENVVTQGWIGGPTQQSTVSNSVPITVAAGTTLITGTVTYWPLSAPDQIHTLATGVSGAPGAAIAQLDTTVLANGPWVVKLDGTDNTGASQVSEVAVTVTGDYKPGRVVVEETEFTVPAMGMPIVVGRRYDSLERDFVGDFGNGWSLTIGNPRLETDPAHNVTITMPDGRRASFYFQASSATASITFAWLYQPRYVPEAGTYGSLTSDGCSLMVRDSGQLVCFLDGSLDYAPTTYTYTDPFGRAYKMSASGALLSITDRQQNVLTFSAAGISSNAGETVAITRDGVGRITQITTPSLDLGNGKLIYTYAYDAAGDLSTVGLPVDPQHALTIYGYDDDHLLLTTKDPNGNVARRSTYDDSSRLVTDTDALGNVTSYAYDLTARTTTIVNPDNGTVQQNFDPNGLLLKEIDPLGRATSHTYDTNRNELTRTNALNEVSRFTYDSNGNQTSRSNGRGEMTSYTYNELSEPLTTKDPAGHTTTTTYDALGIPVTISDERGLLAKFESSEHGLPVSATDPEGNTTYFAYDGYGDMTNRTDRLGRATYYAYDGIGRRTSRTDPRGGVTTYYYDGLSHLVKVFDPVTGHFASYDFNGNDLDDSLDNNYGPYHRETRHSYDALNHLIKDKYFDGTTRLYTRDFRGNKLTETDESGRVTTYTYDKAGQLTKTTYPDGSFKTLDYDGVGRLLTATDERGNSTTYEYEAGCGCPDRITKVTDPLGNTTVTAYDSLGRRSSVTDAVGNATSYLYDSRGHLVETDYADGTKETDTYDAIGRRSSHTDQMASVTQYGYDAEGQLLSVTDALGKTTQYAYDPSGNLSSETDANGHVTSYAYDGVSRKVGRTLPLGQTETFAYDIAGNEVSHVDFRGKNSTYNFDGRDRILSKVPDPTLGEPTVTFTYNSTGTRASMVDASGTTRYGYDSRDRLQTKSTSAGMLTYTYDLAGNVATIRSSNPDGTSVDYYWDAANQLSSLTDNRAGGITTAAYTPTGRPSAITQPTQVGASYAYDTRERVTSLQWARATDAPFASWSYDFNLRGQRKGVTDVTGRHVAYGYDAVSRLVSEAVTSDPRGATGDGELTYVLDPEGDRLSRASTLSAIGAQSLTYDANDQLSSDSYDPNGNTTVSDGHTYSYDFENRLVSKDGSDVTIVYDGDGNRAAKSTGGVTTKYLTDELNPTGYLQVLEETSNGIVKVAYTYGTMIVSERRVSDGGSVSYFGYDAQGNISFLTDATGSVTDSYDYDAFGNIVASTGSTPNTRLFVGEEVDPDLGLMNLRARQYKPGTGRLLTRDSWMGVPSRPPTLGQYAYANYDPVNWRDPSGHLASEEVEDMGVVVRAAAPAAEVQAAPEIIHTSVGIIVRNRIITFGGGLFVLGLKGHCAAGKAASWFPLSGSTSGECGDAVIECDTEYPGEPKCAVDDQWIYSDFEAALGAWEQSSGRALTAGPMVGTEPDPTTGRQPQCPAGKGEHYDVFDAATGERAGSIVCCTCCRDTSAGPFYPTDQCLITNVRSQSKWETP